MIHGRQSARPTSPMQGRVRHATPGLLRRLAWGVAALVGLLGMAACSEDGGTQPGTLRFGQIGSLEAVVEVPLRQGEGTLEQRLEWRSSGYWTFTERIFYQGLIGDEAVRDTHGDPSPFVVAYASLVTAVNGASGLDLFIDSLPQTLDPECEAIQSRVRFEIRDGPSGETASWTRCASGSLGNLTTRTAGPETAASRVVAAILQTRDGTVGSDFVSTYAGSVPFGTLDRGQDSQAGLSQPTVFVDEEAWAAFWSSHAPGEERPSVDFPEEVVVVAAVGVRDESGDSVEVRRVLQVNDGSLVEVWERVPGDFCTPAERIHVPYHIVVAPRIPEPIRFAEIRVETVPCGG